MTISPFFFLIFKGFIHVLGTFRYQNWLYICIRLWLSDYEVVYHNKITLGAKKKHYYWGVFPSEMKVADQ